MAKSFGFKATKWDGQKVITRVDQAAVFAVQDGLEFLLGESNKYVPHDEGTLQRSGTVSIDFSGKKIKGIVSYDTPYAVRWHETPANFQKGRTHKYLERALEENRASIEKFIANKVGLVF